MALTDAVTTAMAADGILAGVGGWPSGVKPGYAKPFVVIWPEAPVRTAAKLSDPLGVETTVLICHCAGQTPEAVAIAERSLFRAVTRLYRQEIDGQVVDRMPAQAPAQALSKDNTVSPALYDLPVEWRIRTSPA